MKAAIIAGGFGTRIRSVTGDLVPKALMSIDGAPLLAHHLRLLAGVGIRDVAIMAGHLAEKLVDAVAPHLDTLGMNGRFFVETSPRGTAGCLSAARDFLGAEAFLVLYGDMYAELDLARLLRFHEHHGGCATLVARPNDHPSDSDLLKVDDEGRVTALLPKRSRPAGFYQNLVPSALYVLSPSVFECIDDAAKQDFMHDVFPKLLGSGRRVFAYRTTEYLRDIGTPEGYRKAQEDIASGLPLRRHARSPRPTVFLDRDGVLNAALGGHGVLSADELSLLERAASAVRLANQRGHLAVVVTNQPQVAKGMTSIEELDRIHARLETELGQAGAFLDRIYSCPHHPERGFEGERPEYKITCACRKPLAGMLERAAKELPIDAARSVMVGDRGVDMAAARAFGITAIGVRTGHGCRQAEGEGRPDLLVDDVFDAVDVATSEERKTLAACARIEDLVSRPRGAPLVVGIGGRARSGKSVFAFTLAERLRRQGRVVARISLDENVTGEEPSLRPEIVEALAQEHANADVVLVEGRLALHPVIRERFDLRILVTCSGTTAERRLGNLLAWQGKDVTTAPVRDDAVHATEMHCADLVIESD
ncbi:HAD-IIIA family hydrolase [Polyangium sp. 6x1]|uniref:HAD-IIIA family hydrolase n=1 Tax=Polyangium sp. 6x1 TaxID=3042689 RepID=UPI0024829B14|nr:HAD-IIIA family hydrolase [Polyangium sp. 6x1]MDI1443031.1 HAD-IIIA family hydrolase [Polyangium sp. 6x1]